MAPYQKFGNFLVNTPCRKINKLCIVFHTSLGHPCGVCNNMVGRPSRHIFDKLDKTFASLWLSYGCSRAKVKISHRVTPNAHTSLFVVNLP